MQVYSHQLGTVVTGTLAPTSDGGTRLHVDHTGLRAEDEFAYTNMARDSRTSVQESVRNVLDSVS